MKTIQQTIKFLVAILFAQTVTAQTPATDPHWQLVWEDNFVFFDGNKWNKEHLVGPAGTSLVFIDNNVSVSNGNLELGLKLENYSCPPWAINANYFFVNQYLTGLPYTHTGGAVKATPLFNVQYGFIEARMKIPYTSGIFPAFWTFTGDGVVISGGAEEIDIFEIIASDENGNIDEPYILHTNIHDFPFPIDLSSDDFSALAIDLSPNFNYSDWHVYAIEWNPNRITWYVDGLITRILFNHNVVDPQKIIINHGLASPVPLSSNLPTKMLVDYLKVYEPINDCNTSLNVCNYNFSNHDNRVKKQIIIGKFPLCFNTLQPGDNVHLRATDEVQINRNFVVPIGAELFINVDPCH